MSWTKKRERLHEAAVSTIRAISKNKKISSNTGLSQRPPSNNHAVSYTHLTLPTIVGV